MNQDLHTEFNGIPGPSRLLNDRDLVRNFTISVLSENKSGLLNGITIIFSRRKINIEAINCSETEVEGISRYNIVIESNRDEAEKVMKQIRKEIEVLGAFLYEEDEIYYQEIALYKLPMKPFLGSVILEEIVRSNGARILATEEDHVVLEKTGHPHETKGLLEKLKPYNILEYIRSGRVAISKSKRETLAYLKQLEEDSKLKVTED